jgi:hypothetical protein
MTRESTDDISIFWTKWILSVQNFFTSNALILDWSWQCVVVLIGPYPLLHANILLVFFIFYLYALGTTEANTLLTRNEINGQILNFSVPYFSPSTKLMLTPGRVSDPISFWRLTRNAVYVLLPKTKDRIQYINVHFLSGAFSWWTNKCLEIGLYW